MLQLLNPWMLLGLLAIAAPILIHLLHRYRVRSTPFAGMRFLDQVIVRLRRQLRWQGILLLLIRCSAIAILVIALAQPLWRSQQDFSQLLERQGATAAVIVFDNSASSRQHFAKLQLLAHSYINTLRSGDAVSIISVDQQNIQTIYDFNTAHAIIDRLEHTDARSDVAVMLQSAELAMRAHVNPYKEIIVVTDGQKSDWDDSSLNQIETLRDNLSSEQNEPRFIMLAPQQGYQVNNSSIRLLQSSQQVLAVGQRCLISIAIQHEGAVPEHQCIVRIRADGRVIDERVIDRSADVEEIIHCEYEFSEAGSHYISAELVGLRDSIPSDNIRYTSIEVTKRIPVLLIDSHDGKQLRFLTYALNASIEEQSAFVVEHANITDISAERLAAYPVVVLADTVALDSQSIATIERYVVGGGNIIVALGEQSQASIINSLWSRNGDGFLPCNIMDAREVPSGTLVYPQFKQHKHPAFATLPNNRDELFSSCSVSRFMPLDVANVINDENFNILMTLNTGEAFLVERHRGQGRVLLCASSMHIDWTDIPSHGVFVPWVRGLCSYLASFLLPPRNIHCGESIIHLQHESGQDSFVDQDGNTIEHKRGSWQGHQVARSETIWRAGLYAARHQHQRTWYAVNVPSSEQQIDLIDQQWLEEAIPQMLLMHNEEEINNSWGSGDDSATALWSFGILLCIALLAVEMFYVRTLTQSEHAQ